MDQEHRFYWAARAAYEGFVSQVGGKLLVAVEPYSFDELASETQLAWAAAVLAGAAMMAKQNVHEFDVCKEI